MQEMPVTKTAAALAASFALAAAFSLAGCSKASQKSAAQGNSKLELAPEFKLQDSNGQTVRLSDYKGKVVLLDFWATWCGPCKVEIPWFMDFEKEFKDRGFTVLGVSMDEDGWKVVKPYMADMKMNYPVLLGNDDVSAKYGGLDSLPTTLLIDRGGHIVSKHIGITGGKDDFKNAIVELLDAHDARGVSAPGGALALLTRSR
jgi:peroxiredoxin